MQEKNFDILRYLFVLKLKEDWAVIIDDLRLSTHRFNNPLLKQQIKNPIPPTSLEELKTLTNNGEALFTSIQEVLKKRLVDIIKERNEPHRISQAAISRKWLQEFIDPTKKRGKNKLQYKMENLELITLYVGVKEGYHKFEEFCECYEIYKNVREWYLVIMKMINIKNKEDSQNTINILHEKVQTLKHFKEEHKALLIGDLAINEDFDAIPAILEQEQLPPSEKNIAEWTLIEFLVYIKTYKESFQLVHIGHEIYNRELAPKTPKKYFWLSFMIIIAAVFLGTILTIFYYNYRPHQYHIYTPEECKKITFKILKQDSNGKQSSFVLYYDFGNLPLDDSLNLEVDTSTDWFLSSYGKNGFAKRTDTLYLHLQHPINYIYLRTKNTNQFLIVLNIDTPTDWVGYATEVGKDVFTTLFSDSSLINKGTMQFPAQFLPEFPHINTNAYYTRLIKKHPFGIPIDEATLEIRLKPSERLRGNNCMDLSIGMVANEKGIFIKKVTQGCSTFGVWYVARDYFSGGVQIKSTPEYYQGKKYFLEREHKIDADALTQPNTKWAVWQTWRITIKDKKFYFYIDGKLQHQALSYGESIGMFKSIRIDGKGSIAVDWIRVLDGQNKEIYFKDF